MDYLKNLKFSPLNYSRVMGVYAIRCKENGRVYIGQSTDINGRIASHLHNLIEGQHSNNDMQLDFEIYGQAEFETAIVEQCDEDVLIGRERIVIMEAIKNGDRLYNKERFGLERQLRNASTKD